MITFHWEFSSPTSSPSVPCQDLFCGKPYHDPISQKAPPLSLSAPCLTTASLRGKPPQSLHFLRAIPELYITGSCLPHFVSRPLPRPALTGSPFPYLFPFPFLPRPLSWKVPRSLLRPNVTENPFPHFVSFHVAFQGKPPQSLPLPQPYQNPVSREASPPSFHRLPCPSASSPSVPFRDSSSWEPLPPLRSLPSPPCSAMTPLHGTLREP